MKKLINLILLILIVNYTSGQSLNDNNKRIQKAKKTAVRVFIDNVPVGTGFFISNNGLVVTCMHVIENEQLKIKNDSVISRLEIEIYHGEKYLVKIPNSLIKGVGYLEAKLFDYMILETLNFPGTKDFYKIGNYKTVSEGQEIYTCGYPFGIEQPITSFGLISSKWQQPIKFNDSLSINRDVAWLDLAMNKGNSGGPILVKTDNPDSDFVVGIATFNLNVFAVYADQFKKLAQNRNVNMILGGFDFKAFAELTAISIESGYYGFGGLVSIEYAASRLK